MAAPPGFACCTARAALAAALARKSVMHPSTPKEVGAGLRREAHVGFATLTSDARLAGKQKKERALAALKTARMCDPAYW